jgi:hypothetical protein
MASTVSRYDLFLSYNSADHRIVEEIARKLRDEGLEPFLDRWYLVPGGRWRPKLEETLSSCKAVAIFVGPGQMGSWQQREVDVALDLQYRNPDLSVVPVLLPGCEPPLGFLRQLTWVDLRSGVLDQGIAILIKAARGEAPGPDLQRDFDSVRASICPYRGLLHFREEDAPFFFGREGAVDILTSAVQRQPFVAVVGASGSGKSSIVHAGLVPRLRSDHSTTWEVISLTPTYQPLEALAKALVPFLEPTKEEFERLDETRKLSKLFADGNVSLYDAVQRICDTQRDTDRVLIFVDQFEELYMLVQNDAHRRKFVDELITASTLSGPRLTVVISLRGDFVGKALAYRPLSDRLQGAQINLGPMIREELECAIRKPAEKIGLAFESGLVRRILNDAGDEPGNLPLLDFVLKELWENRRGHVLLNETYDAIGGLQGAVATKADELLRDLSSADRKIFQRIFLRIVRPLESGLDTRRRATFSELPPEGPELVFKLANERLLVTNQSTSGLEQTVEVAHEALISDWARLRAWVNEDREFLLWRERLDTLLREWERAQESDEALLRGTFLIESQKWFDQRTQDLSDKERRFISSSRALDERLACEERERREREVEVARKLVDAEKERAEQAERARQYEQHSGVRHRWSLFLCYRRSDSADTVDRIYERLCRDLGKNKLFRDIDSIPLGVDFPDRIAGVLRECCAVLVVIGPGWLEARSPDGRRRLDDPQDHVRVEVECALRAVNTRVIPVLVRGASMPKPEEVPESLRTLVKLNGMMVRPNPDFQGDVSRLARGLREVIAKTSTTSSFFGRVLDFIRVGGRIQ